MPAREQTERRCSLDAEELEIEELDMVPGGVTPQTNCTCTIVNCTEGGAEPGT